MDGLLEDVATADRGAAETGTDVMTHGVPWALPLRYHANDVFSSLHAASYDAVAAELPSDAIRPLRWVDGRAVVDVTAFRYRAVTWTRSDGSTGALAPYGEISIAPLVTVGPAPRALPLLRRSVGVFVLHLPVTSLEARDAGRQQWGYPKFVADMDFEEGAGARRVQLSEGGARILTLTVRPGGPVLSDRRPAVTYTSLDGQLLETLVPMGGHAQTRLGGRSGELLLGDHEVADGLRRLRLSPTPVLTMSYLDHRSVLPAGRPIGPAGRTACYAGQDRAFGRFTVRYPDSPALDQYATTTV